MQNSSKFDRVVESYVIKWSQVEELDVGQWVTFHFSQNRSRYIIVVKDNVFKVDLERIGSNIQISLGNIQTMWEITRWVGEEHLMIVMLECEHKRA